MSSTLPSVFRSLIVPLLLGSVLGACDRQSAPAGQGPERQGNAASSTAKTSGEVAPGGGDAPAKPLIDRSHKGKAMPDFVFSDASGKDVTLADFAGRPVLVNLWATWCAPCIAEMPQLDTLAETYARDRLAVLTISQDSQSRDKVVGFFRQKGYRTIKPWLDPENQFGFFYATGMLPTSVLYDDQGREVLRVVGAMDWLDAEAAALIDEALDG